MDQSCIGMVREPGRIAPARLPDQPRQRSGEGSRMMARPSSSSASLAVSGTRMRIHVGVAAARQQHQTALDGLGADPLGQVGVGLVQVAVLNSSIATIEAQAAHVLDLPEFAMPGS